MAPPDDLAVDRRIGLAACPRTVVDEAGDRRAAGHRARAALAPAAAAHPDRGRHRHEREEHDDPPDRPRLCDRGAAGRDDELRRDLRARRARRGGGLDRLRRRGPDPLGARARRRDPRDRSRRHPAARDRLRVERRQRRHERQRRPSRPAGDRHGRRAGGREVDGRPDHEARRLGRPQRRRPPRVGHAPGNPGEGLCLQPRGPDRRGPPGAAAMAAGPRRSRRAGSCSTGPRSARGGCSRRPTCP